MSWQDADKLKNMWNTSLYKVNTSEAEKYLWDMLDNCVDYLPSADISSVSQTSISEAVDLLFIQKYLRYPDNKNRRIRSVDVKMLVYVLPTSVNFAVHAEKLRNYFKSISIGKLHGEDTYVMRLFLLDRMVYKY